MHYNGMCVCFNHIWFHIVCSRVLQLLKVHTHKHKKKTYNFQYDIIIFLFVL